MCGLVGLVINAHNGGIGSEADAFTQLLYIDALRGEDATGSVLFTNDGEIDIAKEAMQADYFLTSKEFKSQRTRFISKGKAWLGHNRKMTIGKVSDATSHPFVINDRYVFMHNGTLRNHKELADTEVDSEALGIHITKAEGDPRKLETLLGDVQGAYACAWIDQEKEILYLLRNKERPLYLARFTQGYIYASEPGFIYAVTGRNRIKIEEIEEIPEHTLVRLSLQTDATTVVKEALTVPKKSTPLPSKGHSSTTCSAGTAGADKDYMLMRGVASKNSYKRFRGKYLGQRIEFWMDDYKLDGRTSPSGMGDFVIQGSSDKIEPEHVIVGKIYDVHEQEIEYLYSESLLTGQILDVIWNTAQKRMEIKVVGIKLIEFSSAGFGKDAANESTTSLH